MINWKKTVNLEGSHANDCLESFGPKTRLRFLPRASMKTENQLSYRNILNI